MRVSQALSSCRAAAAPILLSLPCLRPPPSRLPGGRVNDNPGAGGACEGEDFLKVNSIGGMDVATTHMYER